ncbi:MAG: DEAD/DEAH box helicase [Alphaproteobacteria bacterium]
MSVFENVVPALARALETRGFDALTAVQSAVLAPELETADLVVSAQTGSGKTVAFGLSLANTLLGGEARLQAAGAPLALIIAPTRELAMQVRGELEWLYAPTGGRIASCVGGMDMRDERRALEQGAHIVVGTPGRLVDHIRRGSLDMQHLKALVLDEADEMLNLGFREELEFILEASPADRRTLMFSATMPRAIEALARTYQRDAVRVNTVSARTQHADIEYRALVAAGHESENAIFNVLRFYNPTNALVFCGTRAAVTRLESRFSDRGLSVVALSGELSQNARTHALQALRDHRAQVCVATDVAARGIDLPDLELVIHADLPKNTEALLHRSGRTGRAGRKGASVLIVPYSARKRTERLLRDANIQAQWGEPPSADDIRKRDDQRLLADPLLQIQPEASEQNVVSALLAQHGAANIAAAFVRLYRKGQAAPEDLAPTQIWSPTEGRAERAPRGERAEHVDRGPPLAVPDNFTPGAWVSLSVGRGRNAEPKWLIPMLCKAGGITKRQLGSIRIDQDETFVEIDAAIIDDFIARIGKGGHIEKSIHVTRIAGAPAVREERKPKHAKSAAYGDRAPQRDHKAPQRPAYAKPDAPYADRAPPREHKARPAHAKPDIKFDRKHKAAKHPGAQRVNAGKPKKSKWRPK